MTVSPWKSAKDAFSNIAQHPTIFLAIQLPLAVTEIIFRIVTPSIKGIEALPLKLFYASALWVLMFSANFLVQSLSVQALYSIRKSGSLQPRALLDFTLQRIAPLLISSVAIGLVVLAGMLAFILPGLILFTLYLYVPNFITVTQKTPLMATFRRSSSFARAHASGTLVIVAVFAVAFGISFALEDGLQTVSEVYAGRGVPRLLFDIIDITFSVGLGMCLQTWVAEFFIESIAERKTA